MKNEEYATQTEFNCLEKRFDDYKKQSNVLGGGISLIIAAFLFLIGLNFYSERKDLQNLEKELIEDINNELGKGEKIPKLIICDIHGNNIENGLLLGYLDKNVKQNSIFITLPYIIKNIGNSQSGEIWIKYYSNDPLEFGGLATEEVDYKYFTEFRPEQHSLGILPGGGYSKHYQVVFGINKIQYDKIKEKIYPIMVRLYYGQGLIDEYLIKLKVVFDK
ncbi:MAG: hypothetical protein WAN36_00430 [Calditrichia bacterium]